MNRRTSMLTTSFFLGAAIPAFYRGMSCPEVSGYSISSPMLPKKFSGIRIVHLSDLHNKVFGKNNAPLLKLIAKEKPDIIAMTGDMISHKAPNADKFFELVRQLSKLAPVY
ncbi:MAG: metallophosphoesterase, partial [Oscillospiraceae bacterium]|nr:metallophosphoesterase [Oscillospiraceae bacterium]